MKNQLKALLFTSLLAAPFIAAAQSDTNPLEPDLPQIIPEMTQDNIEKAIAIDPEIDIPEDWLPLAIPDDTNPQNIKGILKGGASQDGKKGALLSIMPINLERFKEMKDPLAELAWIVRKGDENSGYTPTNEKEVQTSLGTAKIITSSGIQGTLQTWVLLSGNTGVFLKLFTIINHEVKPEDDPDLKKILKSLTIPATNTP